MAYFKKENEPPAKNSDSLHLKLGSKVFKEMVDNVKGAMLVKYGSDSVHCYMNRSACEMTGYTFTELTNMRFKDLVHPKELGKLEERWGKTTKRNKFANLL